MSQLNLDNLNHLQAIADKDAAGLKKAAESYGDSWKKRGGVGAYMMLCRKWDRIENALDPLKAIPGREPMPGMAPIDAWPGSKQSVPAYDIFAGLLADGRGEGLIDDVRDLRRYLLLVESEMVAQGAESAHAVHRDNPEERHCDKSVVGKIKVEYEVGKDPGDPGANRGAPLPRSMRELKENMAKDAASGGPVKPGQGYLVGEAPPEPFLVPGKLDPVKTVDFLHVVRNNGSGGRVLGLPMSNTYPGNEVMAELTGWLTQARGANISLVQNSEKQCADCGLGYLFRNKEDVPEKPQQCALCYLQGIEGFTVKKP